MMITFVFNKKKAIEVILYLAQKVSVPNIYGICKLLYLADKASLEKYGRFIFGESYVAMKEGGTPSNAYDLLKNIRRDAIDEMKIETNLIVPLRPANLEYLSKSDLECLDLVIEKYGKPRNWSDRKKACHDDAWQYAWDNRGTNRSKRIPIENIAKMFPDSNNLIDYLENSG